MTNIFVVYIITLYIVGMNVMVDIPKEIYESERACGEFIVAINERLATLAGLEKELKRAKDIASEVLLNKLEASGMKHFAFDFGTFSKSTKTAFSFPTAEDGGKEKAVEWLIECVSAGIITTRDLLDVQQARISVEPLVAIIEQVEEYNARQKLVGGDLIPDCPFNRYQQTTLTAPRKRK